jgi:hypothetical protein
MYASYYKIAMDDNIIYRLNIYLQIRCNIVQLRIYYIIHGANCNTVTIPCSEPVVKGGLHYHRNYLSLFKPLKGQTAMSIETAVKLILIDIAVGRRIRRNNNIIIHYTLKKKLVLLITSVFWSASILLGFVSTVKITDLLNSKTFCCLRKI